MIGGALAVVCASLAGCADGPDSAYPSLGSVKELGTILTPDEQKKALSDLQKQQQNQTKESQKSSSQ